MSDYAVPDSTSSSSSSSSSSSASSSSNTAKRRRLQTGEQQLIEGAVAKINDGILLIRKNLHGDDVEPLRGGLSYLVEYAGSIVDWDVIAGKLFLVLLNDHVAKEAIKLTCKIEVAENKAEALGTKVVVRYIDPKDKAAFLKANAAYVQTAWIQMTDELNKPKRPPTVKKTEDPAAGSTRTQLFPATPRGTIVSYLQRAWERAETLEQRAEMMELTLSGCQESLDARTAEVELLEEMRAVMAAMRQEQKSAYRTRSQASSAQREESVSRQ